MIEQAIASVGSMIGQHFLNERSAQRQNARNIRQWHRENEYNHPAQQMARLKDAGINPHMAYMKGTINNVAGRSPTMTAGAPPDIASSLQSFADLSIKQAQANNLKAQTENLQAQSATERLRTALTGEQSRKMRLEANFFDETYNRRKSLMDTQILNAQLESELKRFEAKLNESGFTKQDQAWVRQIMIMFDEVGGSLQPVYQQFKSMFNKLFNINTPEGFFRIIKGD